MFSLLGIKINLLFNAIIIRSSSLENRRSFPREGMFKNKPLVACKLSEEKKKAMRDALRKKVQRGQPMPSFFFGHSTAFPRVSLSLKYSQKKSLTRETRRNERACNSGKKKKQKEPVFFYPVFYLG